jgi:vitamin B12 transporter
MTFQFESSPRLATLPFALSLLFAASSVHAQAQTQSVLITATRSAQSVTDVLLDYDTISSEEIFTGGFASLAELLQKKRGIEMTTNGGPGSASSVFMRGSDNRQSVVLVDGVRVGSSTTGGTSWASIPLAQIDHVEIVYGPLSSMYGADAVGGVIQIFTKQGTGGFSPMLALGFGSYGARSQEAGVSGSTTGEHALRYALHVGYEAADGFSASKPTAGPFTYNPDKDGYRRDNASASLAWQVAGNHELGMNLLSSRLNARFDAGEGFDDRGIGKLETIAFYLKSKVSTDWNSHFQAARSVDRNATKASFGNSYFDSISRQFIWQNDFKLGSDSLQTVAEFRQERGESNLKSLRRERNTKALGLAYQLKRDVHLLSASLRYDDNSQYDGQTTGSLAYGFRLNQQWRLSSSIGTSFRAPSFNELYYPGFGVASNRPERGRNAEIGLHFAAGGNQFSASLFQNRLKDLLVYAQVCPVEPATHQFGCSYNVNRAQLQGLSLGGSTRWQQWLLKGSLDWQDPRDETAHKRLARRSRQHGSVALEYASGAWKGGVESVFSADRFDDAANKNRLGGYGLLNLYGSFEFAKDWTVLARWNNVTGKDYELARFYATAGSNGFVGLRYGIR